MSPAGGETYLRLLPPYGNHPQGRPAGTDAPDLLSGRRERGSPTIIFAKNVDDGSMGEDEDSRDVVQLENWVPKNYIEEGFHMCAIGDASVVEKMLNSDVAYLMFVSGESVSGEPGGTEIAHLSLDSFQRKWKEAVH